jgi:DNA mismatch endonuclease, patch repair protein
MVDVLTVEQRRFNMSRIKSKNTKPELLIRSGLHARGLRFRLHRKDLPGRPDLAFARAKVAVFIHGCFWHGHHCALFKEPATRNSFWQEKIAKNVVRDKRAVEELKRMNWRALTVWECAIRGRNKLPLDRVFSRCERFIMEEDISCHEISSRSAESCD